MKRYGAALLGGAVAGIITTGIMIAGRKAGVLSKTLNRDAVDWIDETTGSREFIGDAGTSAVEVANHIGASMAFAAAMPALKAMFPAVSPAAIGVAYGTALYSVNIGVFAPMIGITDGQIAAGPRKAAERWTVHVVQGVATATIADRLTSDISGNTD